MSEGHVVPVKVYVVVFLALLVGTALTVAAATIDLGWLNTPLALAIAFTKAALVVLFFMHVRYGTRLTQLYVIGGFSWLAILIFITWSDYWSRPWPV